MKSQHHKPSSYTPADYENEILEEYFTDYLNDLSNVQVAEHETDNYFENPDNYPYI